MTGEIGQDAIPGRDGTLLQRICVGGARPGVAPGRGGQTAQAMQGMTRTRIAIMLA